MVLALPPHIVIAMLTRDPTSSTPELHESELLDRIEFLQSKLDHAQKMATLGKLLSTTTHEFNNVLMSIMNYTKMALRQNDEAARARYLQKVLDATDRAALISKNILGAARNRPGEPTPIELHTLIDDTLMLIERDFRKYRITVTKNIQTVPPTLGNGNELQQVILNLLINARQALREGGEVQISLSHKADDEVNELTIRDNGSGIPAETLPRIFDPFFTTKTGPDETGRGGTGLGLSACRDIIEKHAGRIRVASTVGKGTAFTLKLPAAGPPAGT